MYEELFKRAPDVLLLHAKGKIVDVNQVACHTFGYTRDELIGKRVTSLVDPSSLPIAEIQLKKMQQKANAQFEFDFLRANGKCFVGEVHAVVLTIEGKEFILSRVRDITALVAAESELVSGNRLLSAVAHSTVDLLKASDPRAAISDVLATFGTQAEACRAFFYECTNANCYVGNKVAEWRGRLLPLLPKRVVVHNNGRWALQEEGTPKAFMTKYGAACALSTVVKAKKKDLGLLGLYFKESNMSPFAEEALQLLSDALGAALSRKR